MKMANHPRPGDIIQESLDELNVSLREFATVSLPDER